MNMKTIIFTLSILFSTTLKSQDTLLSEIVLKRTETGIEISYSKDSRYTDEYIVSLIADFFKSKVDECKEGIQKPKKKYRKPTYKAKTTKV